MIRKIPFLFFFLVTFALGGEQFAMSDADRAMYQEMLENNPADIFVEEGGEFFEKLGDEEALENS